MPMSARSTAVGIAAAGALAVAAVPVAATASGDAAKQPEPEPPTRIAVVQVTARTVQFDVIDVGKPGPALGLGDQIVSSDRLTRYGEPAGTAGTVLTVVGVGTSTLTTQSVTTLALPEGQVVLQGIGDGPTGPPTVPLEYTVAVTGGTGRYRDATGAASVVDGPGGTEEITLRLAIRRR